MKEISEYISDIIPLLDNVDSESVKKSIALYRLIRNLYNKNHKIPENIEFKWAYAAFYGLSAHYKKNDLEKYFSVLSTYCEDPKKAKIMDIDDIVSELETDKKHYVFASKLMNFVDDSRYPILDSKIAKYFRFHNNTAFRDRFNTLKDVYLELSHNPKVKKLIVDYDFDGIGIMKQLDIILWNTIR